MFNLNKVKFNLGKKKLIVLYKLFFLMAFGALIDSLSVALILPLISIILKKESFSLFDYEINFSYFDYEKTIVVVLLIIIILYLLKNFYLRFLLVKQANFTANIKADISLKFIKNILNLIKFFSRNNSSIFFRNLKSKQNFVGYYLSPLLNLFLDSIFIFF